MKLFLLRSVVWGMSLILVVLLGWMTHSIHAEPAPYQVYKISYGCLYVVSTQGGGVSTQVTPSVKGECF